MASKRRFVEEEEKKTDLVVSLVGLPSFNRFGGLPTVLQSHIFSFVEPTECCSNIGLVSRQLLGVSKLASSCAPNCKLDSFSLNCVVVTRPAWPLAIRSLTLVIDSITDIVASEDEDGDPVYHSEPEVAGNEVAFSRLPLFANLRSLDISCADDEGDEAEAGDLDPLSQLTALTDLRLRHLGDSGNLTAVATLTNLRSLLLYEHFDNAGTLSLDDLVPLGPTLQLLVINDTCASFGFLSSMVALTELQFESLTVCDEDGWALPALVHLTNLQRLELNNVRNLAKLPNELPPSLTDLQLTDCRELSSLHFLRDDRPALKRLILYDLPSLITVPKYWSNEPIELITDLFEPTSFTRTDGLVYDGIDSMSHRGIFRHRWRRPTLTSVSPP